MRFGLGYHWPPRLVLRRINCVAAEVKAVLIVVVIGLVMLDLLYVVRHIVDSPLTAGVTDK